MGLTSQRAVNRGGVQPPFRLVVPRCHVSLKEAFVIWAHRFILVGYLCNAIAAWMLVRKPARAGFLWLAIGCTLLLLGSVIQQHR